MSLRHPLLVDRRDDLADRLVHRRDHPRIGPARLRQLGVRLLVLLRDLVRRVDGVERDVEEQRPRRVVLGDPAATASRASRCVLYPSSRRLAVVAMPVEAAVADVGEVVERAVVVAVLVVEPAPRRQVLGPEVAEVPLAADGRLVARLLEGLRQRPLLQRQAVLRPGPDDADLQAVPHRVAARHQGGPRRRADRLDVELLEPCAPAAASLSRLGVLISLAVPADVGPAQVVGQDEDDVRPRPGPPPHARPTPRRAP